MAGAPTCSASGPKGEIWIVEIKSSLIDYQVDRKWPHYKEFCDRFFFAKPPELDPDIFPADEGLIAADGHDGAILRMAERSTAAAGPPQGHAAEAGAARGRQGPHADGPERALMRHPRTAPRQTPPRSCTTTLRSSRWQPSGGSCLRPSTLRHGIPVATVAPPRWELAGAAARTSCASSWFASQRPNSSWPGRSSSTVSAGCASGASSSTRASPQTTMCSWRVRRCRGAGRTRCSTTLRRSLRLAP